MDVEGMKRIASAHESKAAKIRALSAEGVSTSDISAFLGIRYQQSYNVLLRAGRVGRSDTAPPSSDGAIVAIEVQQGGSTVLPLDVLKALGLTGGGQLLCRPTANGLLLMPRDVAVDELRRLAVERMPEHASLLSALLERQPSSTTDDGT